MEASCSIAQDVVGLKQSNTTGEMLREKVVVWQFAQATHGPVAGDCITMDTAETENDLELKNRVEERNLQRMAKVHHILERWQGS